jgi:mono/diheme cytochrome c family protein
MDQELRPGCLSKSHARSFARRPVLHSGFRAGLRSGLSACLRAGPALALAALATGWLPGCGFEPRSAPMRFALGEDTQKDLEDAPLVADHIRGSLDMLFGTPQNPGYLVLGEWSKDEFDPNHSDRPANGGGSGEISEPRAAEIRADNARAFERELSAIARGRYDEVTPQRAAPALNRAYHALLARKAAGDITEPELKTEATKLFAEYYPSFRDSAELYRQQCLHCHGVEGGGNGPTSTYLDPRPRDYRKGIFKFTALKDLAHPRREDLYRVLDQGLYGTAMPSFRRFSIAQREGLVDYVRLLAVRGEVEHKLVAAYKDEEVLTAEAPLTTFKEVWDKWQEARTKVVAFEGEVPAPTPESIARGKELFHDAKKGNCAGCHGDNGLGDGPAAWKIDEKSGKKVPAYDDVWGRPILPRNLVTGLYRGGRRPIDIYRRIYAGIPGGPMPGIGESKDAQGNLVLPPADMWALVHYVRSLSDRDERVAESGHLGAVGATGSGAGEAGHEEKAEPSGAKH